MGQADTGADLWDQDIARRSVCPERKDTVGREERGLKGEVMIAFSVNDRESHWRVAAEDLYNLIDLG